jgi:hypothetical protein
VADKLAGKAKLCHSQFRSIFNRFVASMAALLKPRGDRDNKVFKEGVMCAEKLMS